MVRKIADRAAMIGTKEKAVEIYEEVRKEFYEIKDNYPRFGLIRRLFTDLSEEDHNKLNGCWSNILYVQHHTPTFHSEKQRNQKGELESSEMELLVQDAHVLGQHITDFSYSFRNTHSQR